MSAEDSFGLFIYLFFKLRNDKNSSERMQRLYPHTGNELINLWAYLCTKRFLPSIFQFLWNFMIGEEVYLVYILQTAVNILGVFFSQQFGYFVLAKQLKFCSYYLKLYTASTLKESATFKHLHAIWPNLTSGHYLTHARSHISWAAVLAWWQSWQNKKKSKWNGLQLFWVGLLNNLPCQ